MVSELKYFELFPLLGIIFSQSEDGNPRKSYRSSVRGEKKNLTEKTLENNPYLIFY